MSFLTEQIGPLPGGAWLGVIGGGLAIGFLGRRKSVAAAQPAVPATTAQDQSSQGAVQYVTAGTGVTSMGTPTYATNEEWASSAVAYLIGRGTLANRATNAVSHVLYPDPANPTSPEDSALYNMAAAGIGLPPSLPSQAFIPDPPAISTGSVPAGLAQHSTTYQGGQAVQNVDVYASGPWAEVSHDLGPNGEVTGVGFLDRASGTLFGYYLDAAKNVTSAFGMTKTGQVVVATPEQIAASNAAGVGKGLG